MEYIVRRTKLYSSRTKNGAWLEARKLEQGTFEIEEKLSTDSKRSNLGKILAIHPSMAMINSITN